MTQWDNKKEARLIEGTYPYCLMGGCRESDKFLRLWESTMTGLQSLLFRCNLHFGHV